jgi:hypothetical protein
MLEKLLKQLDKEFVMENSIIRMEDRHYIIPLINNIDIEAIDSKGSILLKGIIGERPKQNSEAFLLSVMEANLFGSGTRGGAIGLNEDGKKLTLTLEVDYNVPYKNFKEKLEDFMNVVDYWRNAALTHK